MRKNSLFAVLVLSALVGGCSFQNKVSSALSPTAPSATEPSSTPSAPSTTIPAPVPTGATPLTTGLDGTWNSAKIPGIPYVGSCTDLQWSISSLTSDSVDGTISALCGGVVTITARLTGQMSASADRVDLTASGQASALGVTCGFALTGVGIRETIDSVRLNYQGGTCLGPVSGSELLRRKSHTPAAPEPSAAPAPEPEPQSEPNDPLFGCGGISDNMDLVECVHNRIRPWDEHSGFEVTKRVAWALRDRGGAGLLIKPTGENIVSWRGYTFAAARICYPDGHIYKVLTDVGSGGANGPSWQDEGLVDRNRYLPALDPALP